MQRRSVLLPLPLRPMTAATSPLRTLREIPFRTSTPGKALNTFCTTTTSLVQMPLDDSPSRLCGGRSCPRYEAPRNRMRRSMMLIAQAARRLRTRYIAPIVR